MTWKQLQRRYLPSGRSGQPQEGDVALFNAERVRVTRYRYRGSKIPTPWNDIDSKATPARMRTFDERQFLGRLQERLSG